MGGGRVRMGGECGWGVRKLRSVRSMVHWEKGSRRSMMSKGPAGRGRGLRQRNIRKKKRKCWVGGILSPGRTPPWEGPCTRNPVARGMERHPESHMWGETWGRGIATEEHSGKKKMLGRVGAKATPNAILQTFQTSAGGQKRMRPGPAGWRRRRLGSAAGRSVTDPCDKMGRGECVWGEGECVWGEGECVWGEGECGWGEGECGWGEGECGWGVRKLRSVRSMVHWEKGSRRSMMSKGPLAVGHGLRDDGRTVRERAPAALGDHLSEIPWQREKPC